MAAWTNATAHAPPRTATDAGILRPADGSGIPEIDRPSAGPLTGRFLERYWSVGWDVPQPIRREVAVLASRVPEEVDPGYDLLLSIVAEMLTDRSLSRVEEVAERHGLSTRALQRLFQRLVGVGPKWLLRRYRLHDALAMIDSDPGAPRDLAGLAASLGWCDQSHFTREFVALVGVSPQAYARRARDPR